MVRSTLVTAWFFADWPTRTSPFFAKATTDGVVREPSELAMTVGSPPSRTVTTELVVPRSIPTARAMGMASLPFVCGWCRVCRKPMDHLARGPLNFPDQVNGRDPGRVPGGSSPSVGPRPAARGRHPSGAGRGWRPHHWGDEFRRVVHRLAATPRGATHTLDTAAMHPLLRAAAERQLGLFTAADARRAGYEHPEIRRLCSSGTWVRLRRGVYVTAVELAAVEERGRQHQLECLAVLLELSRRTAVLSHESAARLWGFPFGGSSSGPSGSPIPPCRDGAVATPSPRPPCAEGRW